MRPKPSEPNGLLESVQKLMQTIRGPSSTPALERLERALHNEQRPISEEEFRSAITATADDLAKHLSSASELIEASNAYARVRDGIINKWSELPFATRMGLREMVMAYERNEQIWLTMTLEERRALLDAFEPEARERFIFDRRKALEAARDIRPLVDADHEVSRAKTSFEVWDEVRRADPGMEDALFKPLDPSKYVKRDMERTPRRSA